MTAVQLSLSQHSGVTTTGTIPHSTIDPSSHERRVLLPPVRQVLATTAVLGIILATTLLLQRASGAYAASFGAEADEASHYVTAVMIRDYLVQGFPGNPVTFAKSFYLHYPRVGFGLWPPLMHVCSGIWMLAFGAGRTSIMSLLAILTSTWAFVFYRLSRPFLGTIGAVISAVLLLLLPIDQKLTSEVMLDLPLALIMLLVMAAYARYLETEKTADALTFGVWAAVALLVKYNALALGLLPPLCIVLTGRYYLLRRKSFWLPAVPVIVIAGPWYFIMRNFIHYAAEPGKDAWTIPVAIVANAKGMVFIAGPLMFLLAVVGFALRRGDISRRMEFRSKEGALCTAAAAIIVSLFVFHSFIYPIYEPRYLFPAIPALILLASQSIKYMYPVLSERPILAGGAVLLLLTVHVGSTFALPSKRTSAYVKVADAVNAAGLQHSQAVLVSAEGIGEGMLTAEFTMRDQRPDHYVVRATKVLAKQTLMGDNYQLKYKSPDEIMSLLDSIPIAIVVIQKCPVGRCGEHENILIEAASRYPQRLQLLSVIPDETGSPINIYRVIGNESRAVRSLRIDMTEHLGTTLEK